MYGITHTHPSVAKSNTLMSLGNFTVDPIMCALLHGLATQRRKADNNQSIGRFITPQAKHSLAPAAPKLGHPGDQKINP